MPPTSVISQSATAPYRPLGEKGAELGDPQRAKGSHRAIDQIRRTRQTKGAGAGGGRRRRPDAPIPQVGKKVHGPTRVRPRQKLDLLGGL